MKKVERPEYAFDAARRINVLERSAALAIDGMEQSPRNFSLALSSSVQVAKARCIVDPPAESMATWAAFCMAKEVGAALFASACAHEGAVHVEIAGKNRLISATGPQIYASAPTWVDVFWLAVICRDKQLMTELCAIPISFLRQSGAECDEWVYDWVDSIQTYWRGGPGLGDKLVKAIDGCDPEVVRDSSRGAALWLFYPPMNLFYRFVVEEREEFNAALLEALQWYKDYWTADEDRRLSLNGVLPLEVLGVTCLASDAGLPIEVESDYLPANLAKRRWPDEPSA